MQRTTLAPLHALLALAVVAVWGTNFPIIKVALGHLPPLTFATLRFALVLLPAVFFLKRPDVPWWNLAVYGVLIGVGQFGLLYIAMESSISPGMASLVLQTQVFFTIGLAMALTGETVRGYQWVALALAGPLSGGDDHAPVAAGAGLRHGRLGPVARREPQPLETGSRRPAAERPGAEHALANVPAPPGAGRLTRRPGRGAAARFAGGWSLREGGGGKPLPADAAQARVQASADGGDAWLT